jgi:hypothetical protein
MIKALKKENVSYVHIEKLGGRLKQSEIKGSEYNSNNNSGWRNERFRAWPPHHLEKVSMRYVHL